MAAWEEAELFPTVLYSIRLDTQRISRPIWTSSYPGHAHAGGCTIIYCGPCIPCTVLSVKVCPTYLWCQSTPAHNILSQTETLKLMETFHNEYIWSRSKVFPTYYYVDDILPKYGNKRRHQNDLVSGQPSPRHCSCPWPNNIQADTKHHQDTKHQHKMSISFNKELTTCILLYLCCANKYIPK